MKQYGHLTFGLCTLYYGKIMTMVMVVKGQYHNPCPDDLQHDENLNGNIYGAFEVNSFQKNFELAVELSFGNVESRKNHIDFAIPPKHILDTILRNESLKYQVLFPGWAREPPKVSQLILNGQNICTPEECKFLCKPKKSSATYFVIIISFDKVSSEISTINFHIRQFTEGNNVNISSTNVDHVPRPNQLISDICGLTIERKSEDHAEAPSEVFPWSTAMFSLSDPGGIQYRCGGTLISQKHVITAAHCVTKAHYDVSPLSPDKLLCTIGKHNVTNLLIKDGEFILEVEYIKIHPQYVAGTSGADIAVVIIKEIEFNNFIRPICLWAENENLDDVVGQKGTVVGWGATVARNLREFKVDLPIVSQKECLDSAEIFKFVTSNRTFCAGNKDNSKLCHGSGNGFVMKRNNRWTLRGLVSTAPRDGTSPVCKLTNYVVFTDVTKLSYWLLTVIINY